MRETHGVCRRSPLSRVIVIVSVAGIAAGCSQGSERFSRPDLFAGSTAGDRSVESRDLGRLPSAGTSRGTANTAQGSRNALQPATQKSLRERGWRVEGAPIVEVTAADSAKALSQGYGVPVSVILEANGLSRPAEVRAGKRLVIPTYVYSDNPDDDASPTTGDSDGASAQAGRTRGAPPTTLDEQRRESRHKVKAGETLFSIAQAYDVTSEAVARRNSLPADGTVKTGEILRIPAPDRGAGPDGAPTRDATQVAAAEATGNAGKAQRDGARNADGSTAAVRSEATGDAQGQSGGGNRQTAGLSDDPEPASGGNGSDGFRWPATGRIITGFGPQADGGRNDGINLAVPAGTPVQAAEAGSVIYAGNELEGFGNLVLVQHEDDWVSAYAHAETLKVARGDRVKRGQVVATAGTTGSVDTPQLHFELRKRSKPVDPLPHLASR